MKSITHTILLILICALACANANLYQPGIFQCHIFSNLIKLIAAFLQIGLVFIIHRRQGLNPTLIFILCCWMPGPINGHPMMTGRTSTTITKIDEIVDWKPTIVMAPCTREEFLNRTHNRTLTTEGPSGQMRHPRFVTAGLLGAFLIMQFIQYVIPTAVVAGAVATGLSFAVDSLVAVEVVEVVVAGEEALETSIMYFDIAEATESGMQSYQIVSAAEEAGEAIELSELGGQIAEETAQAGEEVSQVANEAEGASDSLLQSANSETSLDSFYSAVGSTAEDGVVNVEELSTAYEEAIEASESTEAGVETSEVAESSEGAETTCFGCVYMSTLHQIKLWLQITALICTIVAFSIGIYYAFWGGSITVDGIKIEEEGLKGLKKSERSAWLEWLVATKRAENNVDIRHDLLEVLYLASHYQGELSDEGLMAMRNVLKDHKDVVRKFLGAHMQEWVNDQDPTKEEQEDEIKKLEKRFFDEMTPSNIKKRHAQALSWYDRTHDPETQAEHREALNKYAELLRLPEEFHNAPNIKELEKLQHRLRRNIMARIIQENRIDALKQMKEHYEQNQSLYKGLPV